MKVISFSKFLCSLETSQYLGLGGRGGEGPSILRGSHSFQEEHRGGSVVTNRVSGGGGRYRKLTADGGRGARVSEPYGRNQVNFTVTQTDP